MKKLSDAIKHKIITILTVITIIALLGLGAYIGIRLTRPHNEDITNIEAKDAKQAKEAKQLAENLKLQKAVVENMTLKQELITSECELSETVKWDDSWGDLALFQKSQDITFYGKGIYTVDLNQVTEQDITVDNVLTTKLLTINLAKPQIKSIEILENDTVYSLTDTGLFRFGDIKITPFQSQEITKQVKAQMRMRMEDDPYYKQALTDTQNSVKDLFRKILTETQTDDYIISVTWKE
jgi:hypothetical protein